MKAFPTIEGNADGFVKVAAVFQEMGIQVTRLVATKDVHHWSHGGTAPAARTSGHRSGEVSHEPETTRPIRLPSRPRPTPLPRRRASRRAGQADGRPGRPPNGDG